MDEYTRCIHYHSALDIVALQFKCCNEYYPCYYCHEEEAGHSVQKWLKKEQEVKAVLCGNCKYELTIKEYLEGKNHCPACKSLFNPNCSGHHHLYFEI